MSCLDFSRNPRSLVECDASLNALLRKYRGMGWIRRPFRGILVDEVLLPVEGDRETCQFEGAGAATDPYRKDPLSLSLETSLL